MCIEYLLKNKITTATTTTTYLRPIAQEDSVDVVLAM